MDTNESTVNFDDICNFLDNVFYEDQKAKEIMERSGFDKSQIAIINTLIITALRAYDRQKNL